MAEVIFEGNALAVAQVDTFTPANVEIGDTFTITLTDDENNSYEISFVAAAATTANAVTGLYDAAVAAKAEGRAPWTEVAATDDTTTLTVTADTAGVPFGQSTTAVNGGANDTQTLTRAASTACSGPYIYDINENYIGNAKPVSTNNVTVPTRCTNHIRYGLSQSAVLLTDFDVELDCTAEIGSAEEPLYIDTDALTLRGRGQKWIKIANPTEALSILQSAGSSDGSYGTNLQIVDAAGTPHLDISLESGMSVGIAAGSGEAANLDTLNIMGAGLVAIGAAVTKVAGGAMTSVDQEGGEVKCRSAITAVTMGKNARKWTQDDATITTFIGRGGELVYNHSTGPTSISLHGSAKLTMGPSAGNPTAVHVYSRQVKIDDRFGQITSGLQYHGCAPFDGAAEDKKWTPTSI